MLTALLAAGMLGPLAQPGEQKIDVYCSTGDHLWVAEREPVDSPAAVEAMMEWMAETYGTRRLYWRAGGTEIWDRHYQVGEDCPAQYDWAINWKRRLFREQHLNEAAVAAAKQRGMEIYLYTGLFEHGVQPDVGIIAPYLIEDSLRIEHPEWCMLDRWGERRCPGPLSLAYPEVRERVIARYVQAMRRFGYDGVTFYTYVENVGLRYPEEFEFNQPVIDLFRERYPAVHPRTADLTDEQREHWRCCRGQFVTQFLRELHAALAADGRRVMMILDAAAPDLPQPWWGKPTSGIGPVHLAWEYWVREGIVDGLWVQLGAPADQRALLDRILELRGDGDLDIVVRTPAPFDPAWDLYVQAGVVPVAVITAPANGIERLTLAPTGPETLRSPDWKLRAQTLADVAEGRRQLPAQEVAPLADDEHLLVRRRAMHALAALAEGAQVPVIERGLSDAESCVRIAAAASLGEVHRPESAQAMLDALAADDGFQLKRACVDSLGAMGEGALPALVDGLASEAVAVREVSARALYIVGRDGPTGLVREPVRGTMLDADEDDVVRWWAVEALVGLRLKLTDADREQLADDLIGLLGASPRMVQQHAAWGLGYMASCVSAETASRSLAALEALMREFGDGCTRRDAAYGWRLVGNALLQHGEPGRAALEAMRAQTDDRWLAWIAYEVAHVPQRTQTMALVDEAEAIATHERFAPPFPGWRAW